MYSYGMYDSIILLEITGKMLCTENKVNTWKQEHPLRLPYQVYRTSAVSTPISCGLLCPQIVLPDMNYSESEKILFCCMNGRI